MAHVRVTDLPAVAARSAVAERVGAVATHPGRTFTFPVGRPCAQALGYTPAILDQLPAHAATTILSYRAHKPR